jgi:ABC-type sugar transport system substrate-binding protein
MPSSLADVTLDWEGILAALKEHPHLLAVVEAEKLALESALADIRSLKAQQEAQTALRQELTQKIKAVRAHGSGMAISIRAVARGKIGYRNERLVHFGVAPVRKRAARTRRVVVVEPEGKATGG